MLRIKWENITLIAYGLFFIYCLIKHSINNGFDLSTIGCEAILYGLVLAINYTAIRNTRLLLKK